MYSHAPVLTEVELLHLKNFETLTEALLDSDRQLTHEDATDALTGLRQYLTHFRGPNTDDSFCEWAEPIARTAAKIHQWTREHDSDVRKGIGAVLRTGRDLAAGESVQQVIAEIMQRTWLYVLMRFDEFSQPSGKPMSERLSGAAYWQALAWKKERLRHRERFDGAFALERVGIDETGQQFFATPQGLRDNIS